MTGEQIAAALQHRWMVDIGDGWALLVTRHANEGYLALVARDGPAVQLLDHIELAALPCLGVLGVRDPLVFAHEHHDPLARLEALAVLAAHRAPLRIGYQAATATEPETRHLHHISWTTGDLFCAIDRKRQAPRTFRVDRVRWVGLAERAPWTPKWQPHGGYRMTRS